MEHKSSLLQVEKTLAWRRGYKAGYDAQLQGYAERVDPNTTDPYMLGYFEGVLEASWHKEEN